MNINVRLSALCAMALLAAPGVAGAHQPAPGASIPAGPNNMPTSGATGMPGPSQGQPDSTPPAGGSGTTGTGSNSGSGSMGGSGSTGGSMGTTPGGSGSMGSGSTSGGAMHGSMSHGMSGSMGGGMMKMSDTTFVQKAAQGGMTEVKAAKVALTNSSDPRVKAYAQKMIADHTPNNAKLASIVKSEGKMVPMTLDAMHQAEVTKLQGLSGAAFDKAYLTGQVADHKKMLALMQQEASSGTDPKLKAFATMTVPVVQQHIALAQRDMMAKM